MQLESLLPLLNHSAQMLGQLDDFKYYVKIPKGDNGTFVSSALAQSEGMPMQGSVPVDYNITLEDM